MSEPVPYPEPDADWLDNINLDATPPEFKKRARTGSRSGIRS
jgi:hypothetical protein